jgi:hypothetical protein
MITAVVRFSLPPSVDRDACRAHFARIAPRFRDVSGLLSKHFIWSEAGYAGGVYQWKSRKAALAFYSGPWRQSIIDRYGVEPEIEYLDVFCITNNIDRSVRTLTLEPA